MRIAQRLILVVVVAIALLAGIGMLLPRDVSVTRSAEIEAPPEIVFEHVNSLQRAAE